MMMGPEPTIKTDWMELSFGMDKLIAQMYGSSRNAVAFYRAGGGITLFLLPVLSARS